MKTLKTLAAALILSIGAVTATQAQEAPTVPATPPVEAPAVTVSPPETTVAPVVAPVVAPQTAAPAPEQPGRIIFFRPSRMTGAIYTYHVVTVGADGDSGKESPRVCSLPNGRYCVYEVAPGVHNFNIRGPMAVNLDADRIRLEIEPGQTYYIEQTVRMGLITGGFRLVPSTQQEFDRRKPREWTPEQK
jgi:hypothetical protein